MISDEIKQNIEMFDLNDIDLNHCFFHYTNINNLESIIATGLEPRIGANSKGIEEKSKDIFCNR